MGAIFRHELRNYFHSLTAYVFGAFLLAVVGLGSVLYNLQAAVSNFEFVLSFASIIFVVIVPILTMRTLAEERRQRTDQLLYSLPITTTQVVLGKYFALLVVYLIPLAVVSLYPLLFSQFGEVYLPTSYGSLFAFFMMGAALLAVGMFLSALTAGGEVITSRGELVEIGGSFRMPDVMAACGAVLREVGSTNKTRLSDYANAISEQTRALLKVHTSNYRIVGFTESVSPAALAELGRSRSIPVIEDLGSGCLVDLAPLGLRDEPTVQASVKAGVDVLSFSGDKLLGGPQAGIIVGKRRCIDLLKRHPLARALRVDKLTLAALEATLQAYVDGTALQEIPVLSMLAQTPEELRQRAESLCRRMGESGVTAEVVSTENPVGGGAVPTQTLHSFAVAVVPRDSGAALETQLRPVPIIVRIAHDRCLLDMRTLFPADLDEILQAFRETAS